VIAVIARDRVIGREKTYQAMNVSGSELEQEEYRWKSKIKIHIRKFLRVSAVKFSGCLRKSAAKSISCFVPRKICEHFCCPCSPAFLRLGVWCCFSFFSPKGFLRASVSPWWILVLGCGST
jgi:hypothetical protein